MRTPVPSKAEGFSLKDDCTLSGRRLRRDERSAQPVRGTGEYCSRVEGGGYVDLTTLLVPSGSRHALLPAHGVVVVRTAGMKRREKEVLCE